MITELLAALKAVPRILDALERLADATTVMAAKERAKEKNELLETLVDRARAARDERMYHEKIRRAGANNDSESKGME